MKLVAVTADLSVKPVLNKEEDLHSRGLLKVVLHS